MRILIVKLGSIGDIVHTLPALAAMRRALPGAEISWVVERRSAEILRDNQIINRLIEVDTKALRRWPVSGETLLATRHQLRRLRASSFDVALDFQGLIKSAFIARLSGARRRYGFAPQALREPASRFLLSRTINVPLRSHVIVKNLTLARDALKISVPSDPSRFEFPINVSRAHEIEAETTAAGLHERFAILNPGGGWPTKLWSAERFGQLADELWTHHSLSSIITHGPGEAELAATVLNASRSGRARVANVSLKGFYALARRARLYVGGDTGPTHLAVAAGTPVAGLFGPTEWWRNGSPRPSDICIERNDINCRTDCHRRSCSQWICMDISVEQTLYFIGERLRQAGQVAATEAGTFA
ncbi:MAG: heptosyltransferase [Blastocatellia bacterium]|nr:heptosyltransferase [Blastocatellia bacterium]